MNGKVCLGGTSHELDTRQIGMCALQDVGTLLLLGGRDARDFLALMQVKRMEQGSWMVFFPVGEFCIWARRQTAAMIACISPALLLYEPWVGRPCKVFLVGGRWEKTTLWSLGITTSHCLTKCNILCKSMQRDHRKHILKRTNIALKSVSKSERQRACSMH